jgi:hypothetical protein
MRPPGAVYTLVRISNTDATRPSKEMQSGNVAIRKTLTKQRRIPENTITSERLKAQGKSIKRVRLTGSLLRSC